MQRTELTGVKGRIGKLRTDLAKVRGFHEKGCPVGASLNEAYADLVNAGAHIRWLYANADNAPDEALQSLSTEYKALLEEFEALAETARPAGKGMVVESKSTLPAFFSRITARRRGLWKWYEAVTTVFGIALIAFTLVLITGISATGGVPFVAFPEGTISGWNVLACVAGCIMGFCIHEFSHGIVLANNGIAVNRVGASAGSFIGGYVEAEENGFAEADPRVRFRFNAAGIGSNALTALLLTVAGLLFSSWFLLYLALGNVFFGVLNAFPVSPMDGGWVYEDLVDMYLTDERTKRAFLAGRYVFLPLWLFLFIFSALC